MTSITTTTAATVGRTAIVTGRSPLPPPNSRKRGGDLIALVTPPTTSPEEGVDGDNNHGGLINEFDACCLNDDALCEALEDAELSFVRTKKKKRAMSSLSCSSHPLFDMSCVEDDALIRALDLAERSRGLCSITAASEEGEEGGVKKAAVVRPADDVIDLTGSEEDDWFVRRPEMYSCEDSEMCSKDRVAQDGKENGGDAEGILKKSVGLYALDLSDEVIVAGESNKLRRHTPAHTDIARDPLHDPIAAKSDPKPSGTVGSSLSSRRAAAVTTAASSSERQQRESLPKIAPPLLSLAQMVEEDSCALAHDSDRCRLAEILVMQRRNLEGYVNCKCKDICGHPPRLRSLKAKIDFLNERGNVPWNFIQAMHAIRDYGNSAAHDKPLPDRTEAERAVKHYLHLKRTFEKRLNSSIRC